MDYDATISFDNINIQAVNEPPMIPKQGHALIFMAGFGSETSEIRFTNCMVRNQPLLFAIHSTQFTLEKTKFMFMNEMEYVAEIETTIE